MENHFKATILIADSESDDLALMKEPLQGRYHARLATSGADALRLAAVAPRPDLVLLGAGMDARAAPSRSRRNRCSRGKAAAVLLLVVRAGDRARVAQERVAGAERYFDAGNGVAAMHADAA